MYNRTITQPQQRRLRLHVTRRVAHLAGFILLCSVGTLPRAGAHEVDQFALPVGAQFADVGPELTAGAYDCMIAAMQQTNAAIIHRRRTYGTGPELTRLQAPYVLARAVCLQYESYVTYIESLDTWFLSAAGHARYPGLIAGWRAQPSVYDGAHIPIDVRQVYLLWRSALVRIGDVYVGTDKIGHFIHNGWFYYQAYSGAIDNGAAPADAMRTAAYVGVRDNFFLSEEGLLGKFTSSVISNGDLAANYCGCLFYRNLTEPVVIRGIERPPLLELRDGLWRPTERLRRDGDFYTILFCEHMDEVLNPCVFEPYMYHHVRNAVAKLRPLLCAWYADANGVPRTPAWFRLKRAELETYYGHDYGHLPPTVAYVAPDLVGPPNADPPTTEASPADTAPERDSLQRTPLHRAVRVGRVNEVNHLLAAGADVNAADCDGDTALHMAARNNDAALVTLLLDRDADVNSRNRYAQTPLHVAAAARAADAVGCLLAAPGDIVARDAFGRTPLHIAVQMRDRVLVRLMIDAGADPDLADAFGHTPRALARAAGDVELQQLLARTPNGSTTALRPQPAEVQR